MSILVVVLQDCAELDQILNNLAPFRSAEVEVVVIDGGSDDGTVELLERRRADVDFWLSEPDEGIYDAMNKALAHARGRFVLHINAGDRLLKVPYDLLRECDPAVAVVTCRVADDANGVFVPRNDWLMRHQNTWHHQGTFYRREAHLGYDTRFRVFGDFDHNQRMHRKGMPIVISDEVVALHADDGLSHDDRWWHEHLRCIRQNFGVMQLWRAQVRFGYRNTKRRIFGKLRRAREVGPAGVWRSAKRQLLSRKPRAPQERDSG